MRDILDIYYLTHKLSNRFPLCFVFKQSKHCLILIGEQWVILGIVGEVHMLVESWNLCSVEIFGLQIV